jgi:hypothetical protein
MGNAAGVRRRFDCDCGSWPRVHFGVAHVDEEGIAQGWAGRLEEAVENQLFAQVILRLLLMVLLIALALGSSGGDHELQQKLSH